MSERLGQDWPWVFAGIGMGLANILLLKAMLDRLAARMEGRAWLWLGLGMVLRLGLVLVVLLLAVRTSVTAALFAFMGFWLVRWPLLLWLNKRGESS